MRILIICFIQKIYKRMKNRTLQKPNRLDIHMCVYLHIYVYEKY